MNVAKHEPQALKPVLQMPGKSTGSWTTTVFEELPGKDTASKMGVQLCLDYTANQVMSGTFSTALHTGPTCRSRFPLRENFPKP